MKKKFWYTIVLLLGLYFIAWFLNFTPIVIDLAEEKRENNPLEIGDSINPIGDFNLAEGEWEMYIKYSFDDLYSGNTLLKGRVFKCDDPKILKKIQQYSWTRYTGADVVTAQSKIYLYKDGVLLFVSHVVVDKNSCGFQSVNSGWISNTKLKPLFATFKQVHVPIMCFN